MQAGRLTLNRLGVREGRFPTGRAFFFGREPEAMIKELDSVMLMTALPEHGLSAGDVGPVELVHEGGKGGMVEFMTLAGKTIAVVTLPANQIRQIAKGESIGDNGDVILVTPPIFARFSFALSGLDIFLTTNPGRRFACPGLFSFGLSALGFA